MFLDEYKNIFYIYKNIKKLKGNFFYKKFGVGRLCLKLI